MSQENTSPVDAQNEASANEQIEQPTFAELGLSAKVASAVVDAGYTHPTPIQAGAIPHALQGKDVLGIAQTGTGKTAAFVLPMITRLEKGRARARMPRTLILEPTRELAAQVDFEVLDADKRPVNASADHTEVKAVRSVNIRQSDVATATLLFDPGHSWNERILAEQFRY